VLRRWKKLAEMLARRDVEGMSLPHPAVSGPLQELLSVLETRAARIRKEMERLRPKIMPAGGASVEMKSDSDSLLHGLENTFDELHALHRSELEHERYLAAHEIVVEIHAVLLEYVKLC
jgi:hypothetical protein